MAFRFFRRMKIAPGVTLNFGKSGPSVSLGPRGARTTFGPRGRRTTVGLPGTGLHYTVAHRAGGARRAGGRRASAPPTTTPEDTLTLGFFQKLITPAEEKDLVRGLKHFVEGDKPSALKAFCKAADLPDAAFLAGFLLMGDERAAEAAPLLRLAERRHRELGAYLTKYGVAARPQISITDEIMIDLSFDLRGVLFALVEVLQQQEQWKQALTAARRLLALDPADPIARLSLAELLTDAAPADRRAAKRVVELAENIANDTEIHAALLLYKAKALRVLGLPDAARSTLIIAGRRRKGRSADLLCAIRYQRALVNLDLGRRRDARADLETLYADRPGYEDVAQRLGLKDP